MYSTYLAASNTTSSTGQTLGADGVMDVEVKKILVGAPVSSGNIWLFNNQNPGVNTATTGLAAKLTMGSSIATSQVPVTIDLTDAQGRGLTLSQGGTFYIDQTMQVTVLWDYKEATGN